MSLTTAARATSSPTAPGLRVLSRPQVVAFGVGVVVIVVVVVFIVVEVGFIDVEVLIVVVVVIIPDVVVFIVVEENVGCEGVDPVNCVVVVPVGRVGVEVGVVKVGVDPVLVYGFEVDLVEPVGMVVFGTVVLVVDPVEVEKLGVEPVLVYGFEVELVERVGVVVEDDIVDVVIEGFSVVRVVVVCCGEVKVIGVEEAVVEVASKSGLSQQVYLTSSRFLIKFWHPELDLLVISSVIFQLEIPFIICWPFTAFAILSVKLSSSQKINGATQVPVQQTSS